MTCQMVMMAMTEFMLICIQKMAGNVYHSFDPLLCHISDTFVTIALSRLSDHGGVMISMIMMSLLSAGLLTVT
jgi:hypothetical protein